MFRGCEQVQSRNGQVHIFILWILWPFCSHSEENNRLTCRWNNDEGDGFFRVARHLRGDFSIVCRFGGHLADKKDKSTLIFKYQNNASFLRCSHPFAFIATGKSSSAITIDLGNEDIDINPRYADSIDLDRLKISLVLDDIRLQTHQQDSHTKRHSDSTIGSEASRNSIC